MKGCHTKFIEKQFSFFVVIQDVLGLVDTGRRVVTIQMFDPAVIPAYFSCIRNREAYSKNPES